MIKFSDFLQEAADTDIKITSDANAVYDEFLKVIKKGVTTERLKTAFAYDAKRGWNDDKGVPYYEVMKGISVQFGHGVGVTKGGDKALAIKIDIQVPYEGTAKDNIEVFSKKTRLTMVIADDTAWGGNYRRSYQAFFYEPHIGEIYGNRGPGIAMYTGFAGLDQKGLLSIMEDPSMRKLFVHEFTHFRDWTKFEKGAEPKYHGIQTGFANYINDTQELNARYAEGVDKVLRQIGMRQNDGLSSNDTGFFELARFKRNFPDFNKFRDFFWIHAPKELREHIRPENKRHLEKRLYLLYDKLRNSIVSPTDTAYKVDDMTPHTSSSNVNKMARDLGLTYIGFGRFIKKDGDGHVVYIKRGHALYPFKAKEKS